MTAHQEPPYLRIAAEIRARIAGGELAPGDRVPSTRQIARQWNVALATAGKVLTTLAREGVVEARPRAGTVVAAAPAARASAHPPVRSHPVVPSHPPAAGDQELTRERVVGAAVEIADTEGLAALSMRGVAARLGVATMSPYRHVDGKEQLIVLMADAVYGEVTYPEQPPAGWRERLELSGQLVWALHRRHPWLAHAAPLTRPLPAPNLLAHAEWALAALDGHGLGPAAMLDVHVLLYSHLQGLAVHLDREAQAAAASGLTDDQWMATQSPTLAAIAATGRYPVFARTTGALTDGYELDLDHLFTLGLRALLDGLTPLVEGPRAASDRQPSQPGRTSPAS